MLEVCNLIKRYNRIPAVDGVSFSIRPGEILGYVGPNGAGKSTTVKVLTGLIEPTSGEILFQGRNVRADWVGFQRRMGYVPEEPHLYPHLTGREYLRPARQSTKPADQLQILATGEMRIEVRLLGHISHAPLESDPVRAHVPSLKENLAFRRLDK